LTSVDRKASPLPRRTQAERRDESERSLIEATLAVVERDGVNAATFEAIGQKAGYSRGLATQKFGSKLGLIKAVIAYLHQRREEMLAADHVAQMHAADAIAHYANQHLLALERTHGGRAYFMLLAATVADASVMRSIFAQSHEQVRVWLEAQIRRGQAAREIRRDLDPYSGAMMVGSLLLGASMQWLVDPKTKMGAIRRATVAAIRLYFTEPADGHEH
jgi:AcrR family transcriptional regulator